MKRTIALLVLLLGVTLFPARTFGQASIVAATNWAVGTDMAIELANASFLRQINIGTNWTTIRVGIRYSCRAEFGVNLSSPKFAMGVCSGTNSTFLDSAVTNFVGIAATNTTFTFTSGASNSKYGDAWIDPAVKVNTTLTTTTYPTTTCFQVTCNSNITTKAIATMMFVTITKGDPNYTVERYGHFGLAAFGLTNSTSSQFLLRMAEREPGLELNRYSLVTNTIAAAETADSMLDTATVSWDQSAARLWVLDLAVAKFQ